MEELILGVRRVADRALGALGLELLQNPLDPVEPLDVLVEEELQLRNPPQPQPAGRAAGAETASPDPSARLVSLARLRVAERRVVDARVLQVRGDLTRVIVRKPMPGSWTSRASSSVRSSRICSPTRVGRGEDMGNSEC